MIRRARSVGVFAWAGEGHPARGILFGLALVGVGVLVGFLTLGTPLVQRLSQPELIATGERGPRWLLAWTFAVLSPAVFLLVGLSRLVGSTSQVVKRERSDGPVADLARRLSADFVVIESLRLPDRGVLPELAVGPCGAALFVELPRDVEWRLENGRWERRRKGGAWEPGQDPFEPIGQSADRLRRWLREAELDFPVRVHAAALTSAAGLPKTRRCAVVAPNQLAAYLLALPAQRGLTAARRAHLVRLLEART